MPRILAPARAAVQDGRPAPGTSSEGPGPSVLETALWLLERGLWPVLISPIDPTGRRKDAGKAPIGRDWGKVRQEADWWRASLKRHPGAGVGLLLGAAGGVIDIDVDDPEAAAPTLARLFPDCIPETMGWTNAGGKFHLLFRWDDRLARYGKTVIKGGPHYPGLEIRIGPAAGDGKQLQSVVPPSMLANAARRRWNGRWEILPAPECLLRDLDAHATAAAHAPTSPATPDPGRGGTTIPHGVKCDRAVKYLDACEPAVSGQGGHLKTFKVACKVGPGFDLAEDVAFALLWERYNPRCEPPWTEAELRHKVADAYREADRRGQGRGFMLDIPPAGRNGFHHRGTNGAASTIPPAGRLAGDGPPPPREGWDGGGPDEPRPAIVISTDEHLVNDLAVAALARDPEVYQRANVLVTILRDDAARNRAILRPPGSPRIAALPLPRLREKLTRWASWRRPQRNRDGDEQAIPAHPPEWAVAGVAARGSWPEIRAIEAITEAPAIRPDGTILDRPGYDEATGLLYEPNAPFPPIPPRPTEADARRAADALLELVTDFPFAGDDHRAAWLAAALTPLARFAIPGPCPLFLIDANTPGTGKSKLTDIVAMIATGRAMPRTAYPDSDDEMRKRITSVALAGDRLMLLDNIAGTFGGSALDGALTGTTWRDRILGRSEMTAELPLFTVWYATGNNIAVRGDVIRRVIPCRLESPEERPEERRDFTIKGDLLEHVRRERPRLVSAVLTLLRAHAAAGRPDGGLAPLGSYEAWSRVVRCAVHWATGRDPCRTNDEFRAADPEALARTALIEGWLELPEAEAGYTAAAALELVKENPARYQKLREVFMEWSRTDDLPGPRSVGMRLKALRKRVINGKRLNSVDDRGTQLWRVEYVRNPE